MKILRVILVVVMCFCTVFTFTFGKGYITKSKIDDAPKEYQGIITMWQIDSFEGGFGSRKQFLLDVARAFEKRNAGVLVMVVSHTVSSANESMKSGKYPDLISYGLGAHVDGAIALTGGEFVGGNVGGTCYAKPWCRGGYVLISKNEIEDYSKSSIVVSKKDYTQPLLALYKEGIEVGGFTVKEPLDAYIDFTTGKSEVLLGTQRDIVRLSNRGMDVFVRPLTAFNDLYQYASVVSKDQTKADVSKLFLEYLVSDEVQKRLNEIRMFSAFNSDLHYEEEHLNEMQKESKFSTLSAFTDGRLLDEINENSARAIKKDEDAIKYISNILFLS